VEAKVVVQFETPKLNFPGSAEETHKNLGKLVSVPGIRDLRNVKL
jgi:hypothetical protein